MASAQVYRPERDWSGEVVGKLEDYLLGTVEGVVLGGPAPAPVSGFAGVVSTQDQLGVPRHQSSGIAVRQHDRLKLADGTWLAVVGPEQWSQPHALTGTDFGYGWFQVDAVYG